MQRTSTAIKAGLLAGAALLALVGCNEDVASAQVSTAAAVPLVQVPAQVQPAVGAPSTAMAEPAVSSMKLAEPPQKLGAPVQLHYQFDGDANTGQPVTLHLAAIPTVAGTNLTVSIKNEAGIRSSASPFSAQKATASTAYRQELSVTKLPGGPSELHVLVTMDVPEGSAHSWFNIPLAGAPAAGKQQPIKME